MSFVFENLTVYQMALTLVEKVDVLHEKLKGRLSYPIVDQLTRACLSIPLNIAEGNGRWHKAEKRHFFWIARGSAFEVVPIIQVIHRKKLIDQAEYAFYYETLVSISKMLTNLIKAVDQLDQTKPPS